MIRKVITPADRLRPRIDRALRNERRPALSDQEWQYAQVERWIEGDRDEDISAIVLNVVEARRAFGPDTKVVGVKLQHGVAGARRYALSVLLAQEARARPDLKAFRKKHLGGVLLPLSEVSKWVRQRKAGDGIPTMWANDVLLPPASKPLLDDQGRIRILIDGTLECMGLATKYLRYPMPDHSVECVPVNAGGALHLLHQLASALSQTFHWTEAEAVMLVLTDEVPPVESFKWQVHWSSIPCLSRITLAFDPALSPRQVEALYRRVRGQVLEGRYRNITRKHALLAAFKTNFSELSLSNLMAKWNAQYPLWRYKLVTNFGRDTKAACDRLLTPSNLTVKSSFERAKQ